MRRFQLTLFSLLMSGAVPALAQIPSPSIKPPDLVGFWQGDVKRETRSIQKYKPGEPQTAYTYLGDSMVVEPETGVLVLQANGLWWGGFNKSGFWRVTCDSICLLWLTNFGDEIYEGLGNLAFDKPKREERLEKYNNWVVALNRWGDQKPPRLGRPDTIGTDFLPSKLPTLDEAFWRTHKKWQGVSIYQITLTDQRLSAHRVNGAMPMLNAQPLLFFVTEGVYKRQ